MTLIDVIALASSVLTIGSVCMNIIQYNKRKSLVERLRSFVQGTYMDHYMIARACARVRIHTKELDSVEEKMECFWKEMQYINGICDAARNTIIAVGEEHLRLTPRFRHPAFPEKEGFEDDIKLGITPEAKMFNKITDRDYVDTKSNAEDLKAHSPNRKPLGA